MIRKGLCILLVVIGFLQTIGYLTNIQSIRSLGVISCASPLPIVFTEVKGVETFAADFYMQWSDETNQMQRIKITPSTYAKLKGPYNRRNIYGAAIAYGPVLPEQIWKPILNYGVCNDILKDELELPVTKDNCSVYIQTRTASRNDTWTLKTVCNN